MREDPAAAFFGHQVWGRKRCGVWGPASWGHRHSLSCSRNGWGVCELDMFSIFDYGFPRLQERLLSSCLDSPSYLPSSLHTSPHFVTPQLLL